MRCAADIVEIKHVMLPPSPREFRDIFVVFELMETDLHQVRCAASFWCLHMDLLCADVACLCTGHQGQR